VVLLVTLLSVVAVLAVEAAGVVVVGVVAGVGSTMAMLTISVGVGVGGVLANVLLRATLRVRCLHAGETADSSVRPKLLVVVPIVLPPVLLIETRGAGA